MKKLMTTLLAVAAGVSLHAVGMADTGTSFEGLTGSSEGVTYDITENGATGEGQLGGGELSPMVDPGDTYWVTNGTETLKIVAVTSDAVNRPTPYEDAPQNNYLSIKTTLGNPVTRNAKLDGTGTAIGSGYYFDSLVKFTAFEGEQTVDLNGGKLAIWLQENINETTQEPESTNLVITAGYLDDQGGVVATNYTCTVPNVDLNDGGWHRVTVKAIADITNGDGVPGFVVFVDKNRAASSQAKSSDPNFASSLSVYAYNLNSEGALFPSAVQTLGKDEISSVQFDGQGDVDDLLFTATAPDFAEDDKFFAIYLGEHITSVQGYDPDGNLFTISGTTNFVVDAEVSKTVQILEDYVTCDSGWMFGSVTNEAGQTVSGAYTITADGSITVSARKLGATVTINNVDTPYETLADAIDAINALDANASVKVTLNDAATSDIMLLNTEDANISVILDLAGNNITGDGTYAAAVVVASGSLLITNSTTEVVGHVIAAQGYPAVAAANADLTIAGGVYDGFVDVAGATAALITGGSFSVNDNKDPNSLTTPPAVNADLAAAAAAAGNQLVVGSGSASYYVVQVKTLATVNVTVTGGANATPAWTVNGTPVNGVPATLTEGDVYEVVYTANTGYEFLLGAITSASGTAGTSDIAITISDAVAINYTITYDLNTAVAAAATNAEGAVTSYTIDTPTFVIPDAGCVGFNFLGWLDANDAPVSQVAQGSTGNIALTAQWEVITNTVTFKLELDAETAYATALAPYGQPVGIIPENPTKENCVFSGWSTDGTSATVVDLQMLAFTEDTTLYAVWTVLPPTPTEKYEPGESGIEPPSGKTAAEFAAEINEDKAKYIETPSTTDVANTANYLALFQAVADTEAGTVSIELTTAAYEIELIAANATAAAIISDLSATTVTIDAQPGLWYSISVGSTLTGMTEGTRVMATDATLDEGKLTLTIPVINDSTGARFYKVNVNVQDVPAPDPNS